jgi:hypothetical protein
MIETAAVWLDEGMTPALRAFLDQAIQVAPVERGFIVRKLYLMPRRSHDDRVLLFDLTQGGLGISPTAGAKKLSAVAMATKPRRNRVNEFFHKKKRVSDHGITTTRPRRTGCSASW